MEKYPQIFNNMLVSMLPPLFEGSALVALVGPWGDSVHRTTVSPRVYSTLLLLSRKHRNERGAMLLGETMADLAEAYRHLGGELEPTGEVEEHPDEDSFLRRLAEMEGHDDVQAMFQEFALVSYD